MKYYRVNADYDGKQYYKWDMRPGKQGRVRGTGLYMIANELLTERERNQYCNAAYFFTPVYISKRKVYHFFGARFEK